MKLWHPDKFVKWRIDPAEKDLVEAGVGAVAAALNDLLAATRA